MFVSQSMYLRYQVGRAAAFLVVARFAVRFIPLRFWRFSLGTMDEPAAQDEPSGQDEPAAEGSCDLAKLRHALMIGRCIDRAGEILPGESRCLPKAVALQWLLRLTGIPSRLVIAFNITDRTGKDAYHAWVERGGEMLVGRCDRASYRRILSFVHGDTALASSRAT